MAMGDFRPYASHMLSVVTEVKRDLGAERVNRFGVLGSSLGGAMAPTFGRLAARMYDVPVVAAQSPCNIEPCRVPVFLRRMAHTPRTAYAESLLSTPEVEEQVRAWLGVPYLGDAAVRHTQQMISRENNRNIKENRALAYASVRGFTRGRFLRDMHHLLALGHMRLAVGYGVNDGLFTPSACRELAARTSHHSPATRQFSLYSLEGDHSMWGRLRWMSWFAATTLHHIHAGRLTSDSAASDTGQYPNKMGH